MAETKQLSLIERIKSESHSLRGTIAAELDSSRPAFSPENVQLLKFHGVIQHDNRDVRLQRRQNGLDKQYQFTVRVRPTGGRLTAEQMLGLLDIVAAFDLEPLRITSRQGIQLSQLDKSDLREVIRGIAKLGLTTFSSGGDVNCNVMCCPAVASDKTLDRQLHAMAHAIAQTLMPDASAYEEVWLSADAPSAPHALESGMVDDLYGTVYLPHKLKIGVALPEDNCVDVYAQDIGLLMVRERSEVVGYEMLVGGGMSSVPSAAFHDPTLARPLAFIPAHDVLEVVRAIAAVYRDCGNRTCRGEARLKYLIKNWGLEEFQRQVQLRCSRRLAPPRGIVVTGREDHLGWRASDDGRWMLGVPVENGRVSNEQCGQLETALRQILATQDVEVRLTPQQNVLLCGIAAAQRDDIDALLSSHNVAPASALSGIRRAAMACPALPSCSNAITEAERIVPQLLAALEAELDRLGLAAENCKICVTGCSNGCARCYLADIALVGRTVDARQAQDKFAIYVGGDHLGHRLNQLYKDLVPLDQVVASLRPLLVYYQQDRTVGETLGAFLHRQGVAKLHLFEQQLSPA